MHFVIDMFNYLNVIRLLNELRRTIHWKQSTMRTVSMPPHSPDMFVVQMMVGESMTGDTEVRGSCAQSQRPGVLEARVLLQQTPMCPWKKWNRGDGIRLLKIRCITPPGEKRTSKPKALGPGLSSTRQWRWLWSKPPRGHIVDTVATIYPRRSRRKMIPRWQKLCRSGSRRCKAIADKACTMRTLS